MGKSNQIGIIGNAHAGIDAARVLCDGRAQLVKDFISSMEHAAERAHDETTRWKGTNTTYGDTNFDAAAASHGEAVAYEAAASAAWTLLKRLEKPV